MFKKVRIEGAYKETMALARRRLLLTVFGFAVIFLFLAFRTVELSVFQALSDTDRRANVSNTAILARGNVIDRNGVLLATNLKTRSLYADPALVLDPLAAAEKLAQVLPEFTVSELEQKLSERRRHVWIKRHLTPGQARQVNALGIHALKFSIEDKRIYPHGNLVSHVLGYTDADENGLAGIERFFDGRLTDPQQAGEPLQVSLDIRIQHVLRDELQRAMGVFRAIGAAGLLMDVNTGEVLAMASLPDFDPNLVRAGDIKEKRIMNRVTSGVYELGSTFKTFTMAAGLETGVIRMNDVYDATDPIRISRFTIRDDHPQARPLTVPEIFAHSSNIGAAKIAMDMGRDVQRRFLETLGLLEPAVIELKEVGEPLPPVSWGDVATMTVSYGHGIAVSPLQLSVAMGAMVNGGTLIPATLVKQSEDRFPEGKPVISPVTSEQVRQLMRIAVLQGTGGLADAPHYRVGGKTGTARKASKNGGYGKQKLSSFVGVFPMDAPKYLVLVLLDEPKGTKETWNYSSAGWTAAPVVRNVIMRAAPLLGVSPKEEDETRYQTVAHLVTDSR